MLDRLSSGTSWWRLASTDVARAVQGAARGVGAIPCVRIGYATAAGKRETGIGIAGIAHPLCLGSGKPIGRPSGPVRATNGPGSESSA